MENVRYSGAKGFSGYGGYAKPHSNSVWYNGYEFVWNPSIGDWVYWFKKGGHATPIKYKDVVSGRQKLEQPTMDAPVSAQPISVSQNNYVKKEKYDLEKKPDDDISYRRYYQRANNEQYVVDANLLPNLRQKDALSIYTKAMNEVEKSFTAEEKEYDEATDDLFRKRRQKEKALDKWSHDNEIIDAIVDHLITGARSDKLPDSIGRVVVLTYRKLSDSEISATDSNIESVRKAVVEVIEDEKARASYKAWSVDYEREPKWSRANRRALCPYNDPNSPNRTFLRNLDFDFKNNTSLDDDIEEGFLKQFRLALDIVGEIADNFGLDLTKCTSFKNKLSVVADDYNDDHSGLYKPSKNQITICESHGSFYLCAMAHELGHAIEYGFPGMRRILRKWREKIKIEEVVKTLDDGDEVFSARIPVPNPDYTMREYVNRPDSSEIFSTFVEELACHPTLFYPNVHDGKNKGCNEYFNSMAGLIRSVLFWNRDYEQYLATNDPTQGPFVQKIAHEIQELETLDEYESYRYKLLDEDWDDVYLDIMTELSLSYHYEEDTSFAVKRLLHQKFEELIDEETRQAYPVPDANELPNIHTEEGLRQFEERKDELSYERNPDEKEYDKETTDRHDRLSMYLVQTNNFLKRDREITSLANAIETNSLDDWSDYHFPDVCDRIRKAAKSFAFLYPHNDAKTNAVEAVSHVKAEIQSELNFLPMLRESYDNRLARRMLMPQNNYYSDNREALRELPFNVKDEQFAKHSEEDENNLRLAFDIVGNIADNLGLDLASSPRFSDYNDHGIKLILKEYVPGSNVLGTWSEKSGELTLYQPEKNKNEFPLATMVHEAGHAIVSMIPGLKKRLVLLRDSLVTDVHSHGKVNSNAMTFMNSAVPVPRIYSMARFDHAANQEELFSTFVETLVTNPTMFFPNTDEQYETGRNQFFNLIVEAVKDVGVINKDLHDEWNDDNIKRSSGYKLFKKLFDEADSIDAVNRVGERLKCYCETAAVAEADYRYSDHPYSTMLRELFANTRTEKQLQVSGYGR